MRKYFRLFFILSSFFLCSNIIFAVEISSTIAVIADFSGQQTAELTFELKNISDNKPSNDTIKWEPRDISINVPKEQWVWSGTYATVETGNNLDGSYYMYQNNTNSTVFKATTSRTVNVYPEGATGVNIASATFAYSGLVNKESKGGEYGGYIPLSFLVCASPLSSADLQQKYDPEIILPTKAARYMLDSENYTEYYSGEGVSRSTTTVRDFDIPANKNYTIIAEPAGPVFGLTENGEPWRPQSVSVSKKAYVYFGGNFINVQHGSVFGTDQLIIEKVIE